MVSNNYIIVFLVLFIVVFLALGGYAIGFYKLPPVAFVGRVDKNGTIWIHLSNINVSENTTIYVYYGDNVSSKQMWILK
jgi:hypothetical protein